MNKYQGYVIQKFYYKVEVESDSWEEARDKILDADISGQEPVDIDWDIYDVELIKELV